MTKLWEPNITKEEEILGNKLRHLIDIGSNGNKPHFCLAKGYDSNVNSYWFYLCNDKGKCIITVCPYNNIKIEREEEDVKN